MLQVLPVLLEQQVLRAQQVLRVLPVKLEQPDLLVQLDLLEPQVQQVILAYMAQHCLVWGHQIHYHEWHLQVAQ